MQGALRGVHCMMMAYAVRFWDGPKLLFRFGWQPILAEPHTFDFQKAVVLSGLLGRLHRAHVADVSWQLAGRLWTSASLGTRGSIADARFSFPQGI